MMKSWIKTVAAVTLLAGGTAAQACTLTMWSADANAQTITRNQTASPGDVVGSRYGGLCSMRVSAGAGYVQDNTPGPSGGTEAQMRARFYFFPPALNGGFGAETIFQTYTDDAQTGTVYTVSYNGATGEVQVTPTGGTPITGLSATANVWNSIEIEWVASGGGSATTSVWLNDDATINPTPTASTGPGSEAGIGSVRLGALDGGFQLGFDDYESRRTTRVGLLCPGDASNTGTLDNFRNFADIFAIFTEFSTGGTTPVTTGVADFDGNGVVNFPDIFGVFNLFSTGQGACP